MRARAGVLVRESARARSGPGTARRAATAWPQGRVRNRFCAHDGPDVLQHDPAHPWSSLLLPDSEVNAFQNAPRLIANLDVPRTLRIGRNRLAAPRPPRRSSDCERHIADLIAAVEPDVVQCPAAPARHAHPQHDRTDAVAKCAA